MRWIRCALALTLALGSHAGWAGEADTPVTEAGHADRAGRSGETRPLWELGMGGVGLSQVAYPGSGVNIDRFLAVPYFIYRGPVFRVDDGDITVRALKSSRIDVDIGLAAAFGSKSSEVSIRDGMPGLGTLVEIGPRMSYRFGPILPRVSRRKHPLTFELPARAVFDIDDSFAFRGWSLEPTLQWRGKLGHGFDLRLTAGSLFGTRKLNDLFYGVAPKYATTERAGYVAKSGMISARVGVFLGYNLSRNWRMVGFTRMDHVGGSANEDSPLSTRTTGWTTGIGFSWKILESERRVSR